MEKEEEIKEILERLERIDHKEYSCGFEFADSSSFDEDYRCFEERKKMANYITNLQEENKQLKDKLNLIEEYYEENNFIKRMKFYIKYYKEKCKNGNCTNNRKNDTSANYTICNDSTSNTWNNENSKIFNDKEIEERK